MKIFIIQFTVLFPDLTYTLSKKLSKFPLHNMKFRIKHDTT